MAWHRCSFASARSFVSNFVYDVWSISTIHEICIWWSFRYKNQIFFFIFKKFQWILGGFWFRFVAGAAAGATAQTITYPLDLLMARNAAHWNKVPRYTSYSKGLFHAIQCNNFLTYWSFAQLSLKCGKQRVLLDCFVGCSRVCWVLFRTLVSILQYLKRSKYVLSFCQQTHIRLIKNRICSITLRKATRATCRRGCDWFAAVLLA